MTIKFTGKFPEPSSLVGFSTNTLIRDSENRDENSLPTALKSSQTKCFLFCGSEVLIKYEKQVRFSLEEAKQFTAFDKNPVLLGTKADTGDFHIAVNFQSTPDKLPEGFELIDLRHLLYKSDVKLEEVGAIAQARSLLHWHAMNQHCGKCGTKSLSKIGGYRRDCPSCEHQIFPRTDPVVIMLTIKGDQCLLGRSPHFPEGWYSTLAGFVEPGETIEDAVRRETFEESGIEIGKVQYHASQPWPFASSLMIGVHCEALNDQIKMDESELEDCQWFSRSDVLRMIKDEHPRGYKCPPSKAIASLLIEAWAHDN